MAQTRASVYAIFATTFSVFDHEQLRKIIEKDTLEIEKWNIEKTAVLFIFQKWIQLTSSYLPFSLVPFLMCYKKLQMQLYLGEHPTKTKEDLLHLQVWADEFGQIGEDS